MKAIHKDKAPVKIFAGGKTFAFVDFEDIPEKDINQKPSIIVKSRGIIEFEYYDKPFLTKMKCGLTIQKMKILILSMSIIF